MVMPEPKFSMLNIRMESGCAFLEWLWKSYCFVWRSTVKGQDYFGIIDTESGKSIVVENDTENGKCNTLKDGVAECRMRVYGSHI